MKLRNHILIIVILVISSGCATVQNSAFDPTTKSLDFDAKSYFVMGVEIDNAVKPKYQPNMRVILHVETPSAQDKDDRFNVVLQTEEFLNESGTPASGYFRGVLEPGDYVIKGISGIARRFPFNANYYLPMNSEFSLRENEVAYLGRLRMRTRERDEGEFTAGPLLPLLDQAAGGFSKSTFDVLIQDDSDVAYQWLRGNYPALANQEMTVRILPKYDRSLFDDEGVEPKPEPEFYDMPSGENFSSSSLGESSYDDIINSLNSQDPNEIRDAAILVGKNKLYTDTGIIDATISALRSAIANNADTQDKYLIDGLAWCALNLGNSNDPRKTEVLSEVVSSELPKKVKSHAEDGLK